MKKKTKNKLPEFFKPILWSYDFSKVSPQKNKKAIIINTINYGDLCHWRWIAKFYGKPAVKKVLSQVSVSEIRPRAKKLSAAIFNIKKFDYAPRGSKRKA
ncbi:hypothetical protein KJ885_00555 [Patescibacteria group bacterium]|nr:hypothetical protein [Patescibacteria group bacterium]